MAYVPPHKRLSKSQEGPPPTPELMVPQIKNLNIHSSRSHSDRRADKRTSLRKIFIYAGHSISRCLVVPLTNDGQVASSVHLVPVSMESIERKTGEKPLTLVDVHSEEEHNDGKSRRSRSPWVSVVESVHSDLLSTFHNVRDEIENEGSEEIKPTIVARFGKVLFQRGPSLSLESLKECSISEASLRDLKRTFYTDIPVSYMEHIKSDVVQKIGVHFVEEKELYHVKLADAMRPDSTISCKCRIKKSEKKLELYKIELNQVRHLVVDISCIDSNVDLRLALCTKRIITVLTDEEKKNIKDLIDSAIPDQNLKGGLKWPLGKANSGSRYSIVGVWHTKAESFSKPSMRLKLREADRYDFLTSAGEVTREISLNLTGITKSLLEQGNEAAVSALLENTLKLIWDYFLDWDGSLLSYCES